MVLDAAAQAAGPARGLWALVSLYAAATVALGAAVAPSAIHSVQAYRDESAVSVTSPSRGNSPTASGAARRGRFVRYIRVFRLLSSRPVGTRAPPGAGQRWR